MILQDVATCMMGTSVARLPEVAADEGVRIVIYGQGELEVDAKRAFVNKSPGKVVYLDAMPKKGILEVGEVVFSLISGRAAVVSEAHAGYLLSQNYVRLIPTTEWDAKYMVFLLNEHAGLRRQLERSQEGSLMRRFTSRDLRELELPALLPLREQESVGQAYYLSQSIALYEEHLATERAQMRREELLDIHNALVDQQKGDA